MTASNFDRALALVLVHEGGFSNNAKDPGGPTNLGITIATLRAYRGRHVDVGDVKALTKAEAGQIYRVNYWDKIRGDGLPSGVDYAVFDFAVNSGPVTAAKFLQRVLGVADDGQIGPVTLKAAREVFTAANLVNALCDRRLAYLRAVGTWVTFGKGWSARVAGVRKEALAMAAAPPYPPPDIPRSSPDAPPTRPSAGFSLGAALSGLVELLARWLRLWKGT